MEQITFTIDDAPAGRCGCFITHGCLNLRKHLINAVNQDGLSYNFSSCSKHRNSAVKTLTDRFVADET